MDPEVYSHPKWSVFDSYKEGKHQKKLRHRLVTLQPPTVEAKAANLSLSPSSKGNRPSQGNLRHRLGGKRGSNNSVDMSTKENSAELRNTEYFLSAE